MFSFLLSFKHVWGSGHIALESIPDDKYFGARRWSNYSRWEPDGWEWGRGYTLWVYSFCKSLGQFSHIYPRWPLKCLAGNSWRSAVTESVKGPWRFITQLFQQNVIAATGEKLKQFFKCRLNFAFSLLSWELKMAVVAHSFHWLSGICKLLSTFFNCKFLGDKILYHKFNA